MKAISKFILLVILFILYSNNALLSKSIIGVKVYEIKENYDSVFLQWKSLGINTVFASKELNLDLNFRTACKKYSITRFVIFPVYYNPDLLSKKPELYAIDQNQRIGKESWVEFVKQSDEEYNNYILNDLQNFIQKADPDGISLDFIRHFTFWEMVYPDKDPKDLPNTSFDTHTIQLFSKYIDKDFNLKTTPVKEIITDILENHNKEWTEFKCKLITEMVSNLSKTAHKTKPGILINLHAIPWRSNDFNGAIKSIIGQDFAALQKEVDFISPMTYWHMVKQTPDWIADVVSDINRIANNKILPSIQVNKAYLTEEISPEEFRLALTSALKKPSLGVVFWSWDHLKNDTVKKKIILEELLNKK